MPASALLATAVLCEPCVNEVGDDGVTIGKHSPDRIACDACPDGTEPNALHTDCNVCPAGHAGVDGVCDLCARGSAPSSSLTECLRCNDPNEFDQVSHSWASATGTRVRGVRGGPCSGRDEL